MATTLFQSAERECTCKNYFMIKLNKIIGPGRERTCDHWICSRARYQLHYGAFFDMDTMSSESCQSFIIVRKKIRKRRLFKKVQAFCEEKVLRCLLGVFWYAESKNQCWQAEKWRIHYLICIFPRWPPN